MISNKEIMAEARKSLENRWTISVLGSLIFIGILSLSLKIAGIGLVLNIIIAGPLTLGFVNFILKITRKKTAKPEEIFDGFKNFRQALVLYISVKIYSILWTLLFIIPGIIASLSYSMSFFIMSDTGIEPNEAIEKSKKMMYGHKTDLFYLYIRFIPWTILGMFTFGIGFLWVIPYFSVSMAKFYENLKNIQKS